MEARICLYLPARGASVKRGDLAPRGAATGDAGGQIVAVENSCRGTAATTRIDRSRKERSSSRIWVRSFSSRCVVVTPSGTVHIEGRIAPSVARLYEFDAAASGPIRQNLDIASFASESGLALRPLVIVQLDGGTPPDDGLQRQWMPAVLDVSKHHGYAFQWFALNALITGLYVWFQLLRPRRPPR